MRCLIDTNILVFAVIDNSNLDENTSAILNNYENIIYVSAISIFEALHLYENKRIKTKFKSADDFLRAIEIDFNPRILHTKAEHFNTYARLPVVAKHNDPIDRVIISQAITEKLTLISSDRKFQHYKELDFIYNHR
ncbi:MAG: type II toxin-antitoxin system VapC family toxin [Bacteroidia bacterium]|nr:type II toxin-antitoxin system VapC family toxin [Bacteroidia bacterium]